MKNNLIAFHKPYGVVSQFTPLAGHRTLADFGLPRGFYPAGRLDADSEGLLLLTDDGRLQQRLSDPRYDHPKIYWAQVERVPAPEALARLATDMWEIVFLDVRLPDLSGPDIYARLEQTRAETDGKVLFWHGYLRISPSPRYST